MLRTSRQSLRIGAVGGLRPPTSTKPSGGVSAPQQTTEVKSEGPNKHKKTPSIISLMATASRRTAAAAAAANLGSRGSVHRNTVISHSVTAENRARRPIDNPPSTSTTESASQQSPSSPSSQRSSTDEAGATRRSLLPLARKLHRNVLSKRIHWHHMEQLLATTTDNDVSRSPPHPPAAEGSAHHPPPSVLQHRKKKEAAKQFLAATIAPLPAIPRSHHIDQILVAAANASLSATQAAQCNESRAGDSEASNGGEEPIVRFQVTGATGCGKSVVVPLKMADHHWRQLQLRLEATFPELLLVPPGGDAAMKEEVVEVEASNNSKMRSTASPPPSPHLLFDTSSREMFVQAFARESRVRIVVAQPTRIACVQLATFLQTVLDALSVLAMGEDEELDESNAFYSRPAPPPPLPQGDASIRSSPPQQLPAAPQQHHRGRHQLHSVSSLRRVGYAVANDVRVTPGAEIVFATPQYLLNTLTMPRSRGRDGAAPTQARKSFLENPTDIILDEVHRRDMFTDLLLLWCRRCIGITTGIDSRTDLPSTTTPLTSMSLSHTSQEVSCDQPPTSKFHRQRLRSIVVMSATSNTSLLARYLDIPESHSVQLSPGSPTVAPPTASSSSSHQQQDHQASAMVSVHPIHVTFTDTLHHALSKDWKSLFPPWGPAAVQRSGTNADGDDTVVPINAPINTTMQYDQKNRLRFAAGANSERRGGGSGVNLPWIQVAEALMQTEFFEAAYQSISGIQRWSLSADDNKRNTTTTTSSQSSDETSTSSAETEGGGLVGLRVPDLHRGAHRIAMLAIMLAGLPPAFPTAGYSPKQQHRTFDAVVSSSRSADLDEEDRILVFVPGLTEMISFTKALHRIASTITANDAAFRLQSVDTRSLGVVEEGKTRQKRRPGSDGDDNGESTSATSEDDDVSATSLIAVGHCKVHVTLLHSSALGEVSRQLEALPRGANKGRHTPAMGHMIGAYRGRLSVDRDTVDETRARRFNRESKVRGFHEFEKSVEGSFRSCRLILATSVAESSLTMPGLRAVIDCGQERSVCADPTTGGIIISTQHTNASSLLQRRGRVGRTSPGVAIHLMTESTARRLSEHEAPEALRGSPARLVLLAKLYFGRHGPAWRPAHTPHVQPTADVESQEVTKVQQEQRPSTYSDILAELPSPPSLLTSALGADELVTHRLSYLHKSMAAADSAAAPAAAVPGNNEHSSLPVELKEAHQHLEHGILTRRGVFFASFPLEMRWATLVYYGGVFGVLHDALMLACVLSVPNLFLPLSAANNAIQISAKRKDRGNIAAAAGGADGKQHESTTTTTTTVSREQLADEAEFAEAQSTVVSLIEMLTAQHSFFRSSSSTTSQPAALPMDVISEPLMLLQIMRHRYSNIRLHRDIVAFEKSLGLNSAAFVAVDHAVAMCSQRIMDLSTLPTNPEPAAVVGVEDEGDAVDTSLSPSASIPKEWSHGARSLESYRMLDQLRSAALDRLSATTATVLAAYTPPTETTSRDAQVMASRLLAAFVAAFPTNILRAEEVPLPRRISQRLQWNTDVVQTAQQGASVARTDGSGGNKASSVAAGDCPFEDEATRCAASAPDGLLAPRVLTIQERAALHPTTAATATFASSAPSQDVCLLPLRKGTTHWIHNNLNTINNEDGNASSRRGEDGIFLPSAAATIARTVADTLKEECFVSTRWPRGAQPCGADVFPQHSQVLMSFQQRHSATTTTSEEEATHDDGEGRGDAHSSSTSSPAIVFPPLGMSVLHSALRQGIFHSTTFVPKSIAIKLLRQDLFHTNRAPRKVNRRGGNEEDEEVNVEGKTPAVSAVPTSWQRQTLDERKGPTAGAATSASTTPQAAPMAQPGRITIVRDLSTDAPLTVTLPHADRRLGDDVLDVEALVTLGWWDMLPKSWFIAPTTTNDEKTFRNATTPAAADAAVSLGNIATASSYTLQDGVTIQTPNKASPHDTRRHAADDHISSSSSGYETHIEIGVAEPTSRVIVPGEVRWVAVVPSLADTSSSTSSPFMGASRFFSRCPVCQMNLRSPYSTYNNINKALRSEPHEIWEAHKNSVNHLAALAKLVRDASKYKLKYSSFLQSVLGERAAATTINATGVVQQEDTSRTTRSSFFTLHRVALPTTSALSLLQIRNVTSEKAGAPRLAHPTDHNTARRPAHVSSFIHGTSGHLGVAATLIRHNVSQLPTSTTAGVPATTTQQTPNGNMTAQHLWVMSLKSNAFDILRGLVVAASARNTVSILTDVAHKYVYAVSIGTCGVYGLATPLHRKQLEKLVGLYQTGSETGAGKLLRAGQVMAAEPVPAAAAAAAHSEDALAPGGSIASPIHWCTLSTSCPHCTFVAASDVDGFDAARVNVHDLPIRVADLRVGSMILLSLHRLLDMRIRRTSLQSFTEELLHLLTKCEEAELGEGAVSITGGPLGGLCAGDALAFFLRKRGETLQDVLTSLGCVFHVGDVGGDAMVRFYVPPMIASLLPSPQLPKLLKQLSASSRLGAGRGMLSFEAGSGFTF